MEYEYCSGQTQNFIVSSDYSLHDYSLHGYSLHVRIQS